MTVQLSVVVTGCETAEVYVTVANFVDFVKIDIRDGDGNLLTSRGYDTPAVPFGFDPPNFNLREMFPGQLDFDGLPFGTIVVEVTETNNGGVVSGPELEGHSASTTLEACPVETTVATTIAQPTTTAVVPTSATAAPTTVSSTQPTASIAATTTVAVNLPTTPMPSTAAAPTTAAVAAQTTAAASANTLPVTGVDNAPLVGAGLGFLVVGIVAVFAARRRHPAAAKQS